MVRAKSTVSKNALDAVQKRAQMAGKSPRSAYVPTKPVPNSLEAAKIKKPRRKKSGSVAMKQIREMQTTTANAVPKQPIRDLCREIIADLEEDSANEKFPCRFKKDTFEALHLLAEDVIVRLFQGAMTVTGDSGKVQLSLPHLKTSISVAQTYGRMMWYKIDHSNMFSSLNPAKAKARYAELKQKRVAKNQ